jgi:hypothetical protein
MYACTIWNMNAIYLNFSPYPDLSSDPPDYRIARDAWLRQESDDEDDDEEDDEKDKDDDDDDDEDDGNNRNDGYSE